MDSAHAGFPPRKGQPPLFIRFETGLCHRFKVGLLTGFAMEFDDNAVNRRRKFFSVKLLKVFC
jgi:hypothetical protein